MRPSTAGSVALLRSDDPKEWTSFLDRYDEAIAAVSKRKKLKPNQLVEYDRWIRNEFPQQFTDGSATALCPSDLERIMQWKLWRGKDRPMLMSLIKQNSQSTVRAVTGSSIDLATQSRWRDAVVKMSELRGIGPATASAILSHLHPEGIVFMADEVIEATTGKKREYTMKAYDAVIASIVTKKKKLGSMWTPEKIGRALWVAGILSMEEGESTVKQELAVTGQKRKRK